MKKINYILISIVFLGFIVRGYRIGNFPPINADEAALAYNAYSFLKTGFDEHGNKFGVNLQSFNDYKPALYSYLLIPVVSIFGLNNVAIRSIGLLISILTILLMYFYVKKLFDKRVALLAAMLLSISPWHIHFSRGVWEVNLATFLMFSGVYFFVKSFDKRKYIYLSVLAFSFSMYTYHSARLISPFLVLGLLMFYYKDVIYNLKLYIAPFVVGIIVSIPLLLSFLNFSSSSRAAGVSIFADRGIIDRINEQRGVYDNLNSPFAKMFHNKVVNYSLEFFHNWASHYNGEFLFLSGDEIQRNKVPETGQLYIFEIFTIFFGLLYFITKSDSKQKFVVYWLIIAPVAAALTFQSPHALRSQNMIIPFCIISAVGIKELLNKFNYNKIVVVFFSLFVIWSFARYQLMYWIHMPKEYPFSSQYGLSELVSYLSSLDSNKQIYITDRYDQPYILFLYYLKFDPFNFQNDHKLTGRDKYGFSTVRDFSKYHFISVDYDYLRPNFPDTIIVGTDQEIPPGANIIKQIFFPNGEIAFEIVDN